MNEQIIEKIKEGDPAAFAEIYGVYAMELYRYALYVTGNKEDAEDSVQDALVSAWQNISSLRDNSAFKPWLFRILQNKCRKRLTEKSKSPETLALEDCEFLLSSDSVGYSAEADELYSAIKALTPPDGQLIMMSVIGGFKSHELAVIFNMPAATIRSRQKRALEKLRVILSEGK